MGLRIEGSCSPYALLLPAVPPLFISPPSPLPGNQGGDPPDPPTLAPARL